MRKCIFFTIIHALFFYSPTSFGSDEFLSAPHMETSPQNSLSLNQRLSSQLEEAFLPTSPATTTHQEPTEGNTVEFPFSNENDFQFWLSPFSSAIHKAREQLPLISDSSTPQVAILVGQSSLTALLPTLSERVNHVIFLDISSGLLNYNMAYINTLKYWASHDYPEGKLTVNTLPSYQKALSSILTAIFHLKDQSWTGFFMGQIWDNCLDAEAYSQLHHYYDDEQMPDLSMFNNFGNMQQVMETIQSISFSPIRIDLSNAAHMKSLGALLKKHTANVLLINASNAYEWAHASHHDQFHSIDFLNDLPLEQNHGLFIHSCLKLCDFGKHVSVEPFTELTEVQKQYQGYAEFVRYRRN